jgi:hypothetical protein
VVKASNDWYASNSCVARNVCAVVVAEWKRNESARKACNDEVQKFHQDAVKAWEAECDLAKEEKRRPQWTKPRQGMLEDPMKLNLSWMSWMTLTTRRQLMVIPDLVYL